ncbi:hypothetical protein N5O88_05565 [Pseudomonas sp. GD03721]|nr:MULTISPECIES: hypothetical protein [unclassified Pseudomonas]MDH1442073.1 hypothetical protein [Pseudomonas sp. GD03722]WGG02713.1 hypothetical protein N5O88_05565 [Pseudomonas sp. GD03721]WGG06881.1 hypothetical protein N5O87_05575 [Pseudomonas sp. GD03919]
MAAVAHSGGCRVMVRLALFVGAGQVGNALIRWWTNDPASHCELVVDGWCYSSSLMDGGVRRKRVGPGADEISLTPDKWVLIELPWADAQQVLAYFEQTEGTPYGWASLILSQLFNLNRRVEGSEFCSEWSAAALGLPAPSSLNPGALRDWCTYLGGHALA